MTELETDTICLTSGQQAVYSCLCYFDIFHYPVKAGEIAEFTGVELSPEKVSAILPGLLEFGLVSERDNFYFLQEASPEIIQQRLNAEARFRKKQKTIKWFAGFISKFPFVESVAISGSCSKGLLDEDGDVDYFVITSPQKVWLCRTILIAFKKIFLFNSKKYFCVNYFVDSGSLEIPDRNTFVAMEIKTLVPLSNKPLFDKFLKTNIWTSTFLPNKVKYNKEFLSERKPVKYLFGWIEFLLNNKLGDALDKWCFSLTLGAWEKKFPHFSKDDFDLNLRSKKNVSKHHPRGYQQKVLAAWHKKLERIKVMAS